MKKIHFINENSFPIDLMIEPLGDNIVIEPGELVVIESSEIGEYNDPVEIELSEKYVVIYEGRQTILNVFLGEELVYSSLGYKESL